MNRRHGTFLDRYFPLGLVLLFLLMMAGCGRSGRPTGTVTGTVTYKGTPVPSGTVAFFGPNDQVDSAPINSDGSYTATKVPLGPVKVTVTTPPSKAADLKKAAKQSGNRRFGKGPEFPETVDTVAVPDKYSNPGKSGLGLTVTEGSQPYNIDLK
jgi:hypothetical protein